MKRLSLIALALATPLAVMAQTTVFSDNFTGGSTIQSASPGAPTSTSTAYEVWTSSGAPAGYNIAANDLTFSSISGGSQLAEIEAQFPTVSLANIGDNVTLTLTFVDTANVLLTAMNANASLNVGLFNSGGVSPNHGAQLNLSGTTITGGSQGWAGYVGRLMVNGNSSAYNRSGQSVGTSTTSQNQDLIFNNASSTAAYNNPTGANSTGNVGTSAPFPGLTQSSTYTLSYTLTLTAANAITITNQLYSGSTASGTALYNMKGVETGSSFLGSTFDGLGFGYRYTSATAAISTLDISQITILTNVPEPSVFVLSGFGILALGMVRRLKR